MPGDVYGAISQPPSEFLLRHGSWPLPQLPESIQPFGRLDAGASGYVLKGSSTTELVNAISSVQCGETYITQNFASRVITGLRDASLRRRAAEAVMLSIREQQIVRLLMSGKTNKEIAIAIKISEKTVKHYMTALMQKLQVRNRLEVVIAAQKFGEYQSGTNLHSLMD